MFDFANSMNCYKSILKYTGHGNLPVDGDDRVGSHAEQRLRLPSPLLRNSPMTCQVAPPGPRESLSWVQAVTAKRVDVDLYSEPAVAGSKTGEQWAQRRTRCKHQGNNSSGTQ